VSDEASPDAPTWLAAALRNGPRPMVEVVAEGEAAGWSLPQLRRALKRLKGRSERAGFGQGGAYWWLLPRQRVPVEPVTHAAPRPSSMSPMGDTMDHAMGDGVSMAPAALSAVLFDGTAPEAFTPKQTAYLIALATSGTVTQAAVAAQCGTGGTLARWREQPDFVEAERLAHDIATDTLVSEAWRRATEGGFKEVVSKGQVVTLRDRASDRLLELLLKARRPHEFARADTEAHAGGGTTTTINVIGQAVLGRGEPATVRAVQESVHCLEELVAAQQRGDDPAVARWRAELEVARRLDEAPIEATIIDD
jgi:hypothetical protein